MNPTYFNPAFIFLNGAAAALASVCALFFFRFWTRTRDRLFLVFGASFTLVCVERILLLFLRDLRAEDHAAIYVIRLLAFLVILAGIWDKNRARKTSPAQGDTAA